MTQRNPSSLLSPEQVEDPWRLDLTARRELLRQLPDAQQEWLARLRKLVEPPAPDDRFPACLLAMPTYAELRAAIGDAQQPRELDTGTADRLQRFVDLYRDYLGQHHQASV